MGRSVWLPESMTTDKQTLCMALPGVYNQEKERLHCQDALYSRFLNLSKFLFKKYLLGPYLSLLTA